MTVGRFNMYSGLYLTRITLLLKYTFFKKANCWLASRVRLLQEMSSSVHFVFGLGIVNSSPGPLPKQWMGVSRCKLSGKSCLPTLENIMA